MNTRDRPVPRHMAELDRAAAMILLAEVSVGRIVFTERALPAIRVVNHLVDDGEIIIRTGESSALAGALGDGSGVVVAYQADTIDPAERLGWSVVATGIAQPVVEEQRAARYRLLLQSWVDGPKDLVIKIRPHIVTGFQLTAP